MNQLEARDLLDLLLKLEQHEKTNYLESKKLWDKWLKVRKEVTGNPSDHPLYPYKRKDLIYYEQLGESIERVIRHIHYDMILSGNTDD